MKTRHKLLTGAAVAAVLTAVGLVAARWLSRTVEDDTTPDSNEPPTIPLRFSERRYPPFLDRVLAGVRVEGEYDEEGSRQLVVIGIDQKEFDTAFQDEDAKFAVACRDGSDLWHPAVAEKGLWYGKATDLHGDVYALAAYVGPSILQVLPGIMTENHFTPFKTSRVISLTNSDGLLYDYPNVPIIQFKGKDVS